MAVASAFPPAVDAGFCCSTSSLTFDVVRILDVFCSNRRAVVSHYFNFHSPNDTGCAVPSYACLPAHVFLGETSVQVFGQFLNQVVRFLTGLRVLLYLRYQSFIRWIFCRCFPPVFVFFSKSRSVKFSGSLTYQFFPSWTQPLVWYLKRHC